MQRDPACEVYNSTSTREPSGHLSSGFDLSSIYQISLAADALAAVDDLGGLQEATTAQARTKLGPSWIGVQGWVAFMNCRLKNFLDF